MSTELDRVRSTAQVLLEGLRSAGYDTSDPAILIATAERIMRLGDLEGAVNIARFAVTLSPDNPRILRGASGILATARDFGRCDSWMMHALELKPDDAESLLHHAVILIECRDFVRAKQRIEAHFCLEANSSYGWRTYSAILASEGNFDEACVAAHRALELAPTNREFAVHRIGLLIMVNKLGEAIKSLDELDTHQPHDPIVLRLFSAVYETMGDYDLALNYAHHALRLSPHNLEYDQHYQHLEKVCRSEGSLSPSTPPQAAAATSLTPGAAKHDFHNASATSGRVIFSLLVREARTRFGGMKLGYFWAIFEPASHLIILAIVFAFMNKVGHPPVGDSLLVYYFTGVLPYILLTNTIAHAQTAVEANRTLLQIPIIKPLDIILARTILELLTEASVALIMFTGFSVFGLNSVPNDIVTCVLAIVAVWILALGIGIFNSVVIRFIRSWEPVFSFLTRGLYFISGIFYSPLAMPPTVRDALAWNPLLQGIDLLRKGFFADYDPAWLNTPYLYGCALGALMIGLGMERALRRRTSALHT